jgi:DNA-binding LacI/PurR family transcriptional regulator
MSGRKATIKDVAERAHVSKTAVSFAFNNPSRLSDTTLQAIMAAAEYLGYTPDPSARMLARKKTGAIGVLLPEPIDRALENPYYNQLFRGVGQTCYVEGFTMLVVPPLFGSVHKAILEAAVDGFVVCGLEEDSAEIQMLQARKLPFVLLDSDDGTTLPSILVDEREGMRDLAAYVLEQGHRDLLILAFRSGTDEGPAKWRGPLARRASGVRDALGVFGLSLESPGVQVVECPNTRISAAEAFRAAWAGASRPTAVLALSDIMALGVLEAARGLGIGVPEELSVTGFDDLWEAETAVPALTTVRQPIVSKGRLASEYLVEALNADASLPSQRRLHATLVVRDSVGPAPCATGPRLFRLNRVRFVAVCVVWRSPTWESARWRHSGPPRSRPAARVRARGGAGLGCATGPGRRWRLGLGRWCRTARRGRRIPLCTGC